MDEFDQSKTIQDEEAFLDDVAAYHAQRGFVLILWPLEQSLILDRTNFERDARISGKSVSLHRLYNMVMEKGGYDKLSDERMAWRQLVKPLGFAHQHEGAMTFQIKSLYYRNLA
jgi:hypothetical protein